MVGYNLWFVHVLQHSVQRLHLSWAFLKERLSTIIISKFLVTGDVKSEIIARSYKETRNIFQLLKKACLEFLLSLESRTLRQMFRVGVFISMQGERN